MADKPTTPDPAEGGRRKRPAPTIDLTATEVPVADEKSNIEPNEQAEPPLRQPHSAHGQAEAAHESDAADDHSGSLQKQGISWQPLLAGFAGALIMSGVLLALWLGGLVPSRYAASTGPDASSIVALD